MAPLDDEASHAWVFSDHGDRLSSPCPAMGMELELSCGGIGDGEEIVPILELCEANLANPGRSTIHSGKRTRG